MSDDEETIILLLLLKKLSQKRKKRKSWVHPINAKKAVTRDFGSPLPSMCEDEDNFVNYTRMSRSSFEELLSIVGPKISRQDTNFQRAITDRERLLVTMRYLATGETSRSLHYQFRMGASTVRDIVYETCSVIWDELKVIEMPELSSDGFKEVADGFEQRWHFPHVIGAIDGKHIKMECPAKSGSAYFNYKHTFSIVLQGICDAEATFIAVDVGDFGRHSDGGVLQHSAFGRALYSNNLPIPPDESICVSDPLPYVFLGDEAYPLLGHMMRPFPRRGLDNVRRIYNYRHSRARRTIECAFGILTRKWSVLKTTLNMKPENAIKVVLSCCVLPNFVRKKDGIDGSDFTDDGDNSLLQMAAGTSATNGRSSQRAIDIRNEFAQLFSSSLSVPWQFDKTQLLEMHGENNAVQHSELSERTG